MKNELNIIFKWFLYLIIIRHAINIPQQLMRISSGLYDNSICLITIGLSISMIAILYYILKVKRWAIISFFLLQYINAIIVGTLNQDYLVSLCIATFFCGLLIAFLFLKKNQISGWELFFGKEAIIEHKPETLNEDSISDSNIEIIPNIPIKGNNYFEEEKKNLVKNGIDNSSHGESNSINYEAMTIQQQFEYTCATESFKVAYKDLKNEISNRKKKIRKLKSRLSSLNGGKLIEQRDVIRKMESEIQEIKNIIPTPYENKIIKKKNLSILACVILAIVISVPSYFMYSNYQKKQEIATYKLFIFNEIRKAGCNDKYNDYIEYLSRPLRKYVIYSNLKYNKELPYKEFVKKLGYEGSNLIQEVYDCLMEEGVAINRKIGADKFPEWIKEDGNFNAIYLILSRKTNFHLEGLGDELGVSAIRIVSYSDFVDNVIKQENQINQIIDENDEIRKDNVSILYEAVFKKNENSKKYSEEGFREWILSDKNNAIEIYNILLDNGINLFDGYNDSKHKFIEWLYE